MAKKESQTAVRLCLMMDWPRLFFGFAFSLSHSLSLFSKCRVEALVLARIRFLGVFPHGFQYRWVTLFFFVGLAMANGNMKYTSFFLLLGFTIYTNIPYWQRNTLKCSRGRVFECFFSVLALSGAFFPPT